MLTTQTTSAGLTWRSAAIAGSAILAIAVSSDAIASAVKIAATAQRLRSGGRPSIGAAGFEVSADILSGYPRRSRRRPSAGVVLRTRHAPQTFPCMMRMQRAHEALVPAPLGARA